MAAIRIKDLSEQFTGTAGLWKLDAPVRYPECWGEGCYYCEEGDHAETEYVVASATIAMFSGPETYLFAADADGNILSWNELPGSYKGGLSEQAAIDGMPS